MTGEILGQTSFTEAAPGWQLEPEDTCGLEIISDGAILSAPDGEVVEVRGRGVHTRNGDSIELRFASASDLGSGWLRFGFDADMHEHARVEVDFVSNTVSFWTSDWRLQQPVASVHVSALSQKQAHTILIEKTEGRGDLIKNADVAVYLNGDRVIALENQDLLPEIGVRLQVSGTGVHLQEFVHRGRPSTVPEYLHLGGYQILNIDSIEDNLGSICRGLQLAAEAGIELLVTPETSLTGLYPTSPRTREPGPIQAAEDKLRQFIRDLPNAPFTIVGMPVWAAVPEHGLEQTRFVGSRTYDPEGEILHTSRKVYSAEQEMWHGYRLNEFDVLGVPVSLHICHDRRYPELQTLPVMFGCRLVLHPSNGGTVEGNVSGFEGKATESTCETHAFYMNLNAGGGSFIAGPHTKGNLIVASDECRPDNPKAPMVDEPAEGLIHSRIRIHDAFGYWPVRSFRTSEAVARSYVDLYRQLGGSQQV